MPGVHRQGSLADPGHGLGDRDPDLALPDAAAATPFNIHNPNSGRCIGIGTAFYAGIYNCTANPDQTWHWGNAIASGWLQLVDSNNMCLGVDAGSTNAGARIRAWTCNGTANQYWTLSTNTTTGLSYIYNYGAELANGSGGPSVIGVSGGSIGNGAGLVLWAPLNHPDQFWD